MHNFNKEDVIYDVIIIGAGINGAGIARDLAGRGHTVFICDQGDVGAETSANSSKLIHGGLRYLEMYDFGLVKKALKEREKLTAIAPHLIQPMSFNLPHAPWLRSRHLIRFGINMYDFLAGSSLYQKSSTTTREDRHLNQLKEEFTHGFKYQDGWVDDHRLVIANLKDAEHNHATIAPRTKCTSAKVRNNAWVVTLQEGEKEYQVKGLSLINAAGPWAEQFIEKGLKEEPALSLKLVKGSHIVVPQQFKQTEAYILQNDDSRIVFAIPYLEQFTLIGTTEVELKSPDSKVECSDEEASYLCQIYNKYFQKEISTEDILWRYAGVRPLIQDKGKSARENTRDYKIEVTRVKDLALMNIWSGKLTTYRALAEDAVRKFKRIFPVHGENWTANRALPGGNIESIEEHTRKLLKEYPFLSKEQALRYTKAYGDRCEIFLTGATSLNELGIHFGHDLYEREVDYLLKYEWAQTAEDILFRRTKTGLFLVPEQIQYLETCIRNKEA